MNLQPVVSEKSIALTDTQNTYLFFVPKSANKHEIAREVAERFDVEVVSVKTSIHKGKQKRMPVKRGRMLISGKRSDMKKAFVKLAEGESISLFEGSE